MEHNKNNTNNNNNNNDNRETISVQTSLLGPQDQLWGHRRRVSGVVTCQPMGYLHNQLPGSTKYRSTVASPVQQWCCLVSWAVTVSVAGFFFARPDFNRPLRSPQTETWPAVFSKLLSFQGVENVAAAICLKTKTQKCGCSPMPGACGPSSRTLRWPSPIGWTGKAHSKKSPDQISF